MPVMTLPVMLLALEEELGVLEFERLPQGVRLSTAGNF
jgi:DNA-binding transcriptional LysR family regulator